MLQANFFAEFKGTKMPKIELDYKYRKSIQVISLALPQLL